MRLLTLQKPFQRKVPKKTVSTKTTLAKFYILLAFLLITIVLLKAVSIYHIKHRLKQKQLLQYHGNTKLKETEITNVL